MEIKSLANTGFGTLFEAFSGAFADYELQLNEAQLQAMLRRRGFTPALSFAAFNGEGKITAFTLNGVGNFNHAATAYDTGTGTLSAYRGQGLATRIFEHSIPYLKQAGIGQYLLEVLQHNTKAVSVYRNLGFETSREFNYFGQQNEEVHNNVKAGGGAYSIDAIDIETAPEIAAFWDFYPSWQNSFESVKRAAEGFVSLGAFEAGQLVGYCVFEPVSGDITQLAVDRQHRRKGVASALLGRMLQLNKNDAVKALNADVLCGSITAFLEAKNIPVKGKQFEMIKKL